MATRSRIGMMLEDGTIKNCYCHFNGYIESNGLTLVESYDTEDKVKELINLGDISVLGSQISTDKPHTFEHREPGVTVFYGRDRKETGTEPVIMSMDEWLGEYSLRVDFLYLFTGGQWWVYEVLEKSGWNLVKSFFPQYSLTAEDLACNI